ncbi:unnamed protein product [Rotaria sp. Silwood1]|nr:unnamed protein product [Rotaria sp. Silwood1]CAF4708080.1 unnamed protein product [Rotaria sp. Silwood1]
MPNLKRLTVKISTIDLNGQRWEQIITDQLSNLRIFQMEMAGQFSLDDSIVEMREQLIDSFRTPFWIEQRQWFIRCHWESLIESRSVWLYTLPYAFDDFDIQNKPSKSTCPHENDYWSYNHVRHLIYQFPMIEESSTHQICCPNIDRLSLDLPVTNCFWSLIPTLNRVISMKISLKRDNDKVRSQLQSMFDQTPRLYSLRLDLWRSSKIKIIENLNVSVHQLKIRGTTPSFDIRWFDDEECTSLGHSPLGMQCHMLHIRVAHRGCILKLINLMINLRVLYVKCQDDKPNEVIFCTSTMIANHLVFLCLITFVSQSFGFNALMITGGAVDHVISLFELAKGMQNHNVTLITERLAKSYIDFQTYPNLSSFRLLYTNNSIEALADQNKTDRGMVEYYFNHSMLDSLTHIMPELIRISNAITIDQSDVGQSSFVPPSLWELIIKAE